MKKGVSAPALEKNYIIKHYIYIYFFFEFSKSEPFLGGEEVGLGGGKYHNLVDIIRVVPTLCWRNFLCSLE